MERQTITNLTLTFAFSLFLLAGSVMPAFACWQVGSKVEVLYGSTWYNATILEAGKGTYKINYDGWSSTFDERVSADRIRPRGGAANPCGSEAAAKYADNLDFFIGKWNVSVWGGISTVERGDKTYREHSMAVGKRPPLVINADGTYSWATRDGKPFTGKWRQMTAEEDPYFGGKAGIVLLKALDDVDWRISYNGTTNLKDNIKLSSSSGHWDGERVGASKGKPAYLKPEYAVGDAVVVKFGDAEYNGTVVEIITNQTQTLYRVKYKSGNQEETGNFTANRLSRR